MAGLWSDLRFALRTLRKSPGFTAIAVLSLAVGVGVNAAVYAMVHNNLIRPVPWAGAQRMVSFDVERREADLLPALSAAQLVELQQQARSFSFINATIAERVHLTDVGQPYATTAARVLPEAPRMAGIVPLLGRLFTAADVAQDAEPVVLMGERLWQKRYGADPSIVGRRVTIDGQSSIVIGILPAEPWYPRPDNELVLPLKFGPEELLARTPRPLGVLAWLRPGTNISAAQSEIDLLLTRMAQSHRATDRGLIVKLVPLVEAIIPRAMRISMVVLLVGVTFVLLTVCANLANLLLARAAARRKELAVRIAVGASTGQIFRQLMLESVVLGLMALPAALLVAHWMLDLSFGMVPEHAQALRSFFRFNLEGAAYGAAAMLSSTLLLGVSPARHATKLDVYANLKEDGSRGTTTGRSSAKWRTTLAVGQVGLSLGLLVAAGLLSRSFMNLQRIEPGFVRENVLVATIALPRSAQDDSVRQIKTFRQLDAAAASLPGVEQTGVGATAPLSRALTRQPPVAFELRGMPGSSDLPSGSVRVVGVSTNYFDVLGIEQLRGRVFGSGDLTESAHVAVVNTEFVEEHLGKSDALGKRVSLGQGPERAEYEIVGVVKSVVEVAGLRTESPPLVYVPFAQRPSSTLELVVRGSQAMAIAPSLRRAIAEVDASVVVTQLESMDQRLATSMWYGRLLMVQMLALAAVATLLAAIGIYGVISYSTRLRVPEFGVRLALGAAPSDLLKLVLGQTARIALIGSCLGLLLAYAFARALRFALYGLSVMDPLTVGAMTLLLASVAIVSGLGPARRAMRSDPMTSLRSE
jgi:putative ABC transport system permease protein